VIRVLKRFEAMAVDDDLSVETMLGKRGLHWDYLDPSVGPNSGIQMLPPYDDPNVAQGNERFARQEFKEALVAFGAEHGEEVTPEQIQTFETYKGIFETDVAYIGYYNTIFRTVIGTSLTVMVTYFGAYALAKRDLPLRTFITLFILFTMFFSGGLIPTFLNMRWLGLINSRWVLILPMLTSAWNLILCRNFIMTLPVELEDAALIDGAHPITMIFYIMLIIIILFNVLIMILSFFRIDVFAVGNI